MGKKDILDRLRNLDNTGKTITGKIKGSDRRESKGKIEDEVFLMVDDNRYVIQKVKLKGGVTGFRIGYYTCDANYIKLYYGGYSPIMNKSDFTILINKAKDKGWL